MYTRTGDDGKTKLYGNMERYAKDSPPFDALGSLDELNSLIGLCKAKSRATGDYELLALLATVQESLFIIQAEIAGAAKKLLPESIDKMERVINEIENMAGNPGSFLVPGATELSAYLDLARSVARRAERAMLAAAHIRPVSMLSRTYMNRLSSLLYALARYVALKEGAEEPSPAY